MKHHHKLLIRVAMSLIFAASTLTVFGQSRSSTFNRHDRLKITVQQICPVMGESLGSMGTPIKVRIGEEDIFLCCEACRTKQVSRKHWATIHANFRTAQKTCPVMKKPLPKNAKWTIVNGQVFYVCCPPCIEKIEANPAEYVAKLDAMYAAAAERPAEHDAIKIAVQKLCPVMGKPLGSMGPPIKVKIGEEEIFLCCEACRTKQVNREHWASIHANFATAQHFCPVMKKPLPAHPRWTIVNGQILYTCCPPCIEKIKAEPREYLAKLDRLYSDAIRATPSVQ